MQDACTTETQAVQQIEEIELKLHRLYEVRDRVPAEEKAVIEERIREMKATIERLKTHLHG